MDAHSSDSESSEQTVNEDAALNETLDTNEYRNDIKWTDDMENVSNKVPQTFKKKPTQSDRCPLRYFINRQYGRNISHNVHSSLFAVRRLDLLHKLTRENRRENSTITSLSFNAKGNYLVNGSNDDGTISIWDWEKGKKLTTLPVNSPIYVFKFHQLKWLPLDKERFIISSNSNGEVCMLDTRTGDVDKIFCDEKNLHSFASHSDFPCIVLIADDDSYVFSLDLRENRVTKVLSAQVVDGQQIQLYSIDIHPLNAYEFCVAGTMSCINVYDRRRPSVCLYQMYPRHMGLNGFRFVDHVLYNHDGSEIAAAYGDEAVYLFDTKRTGRRRNYAHRYGGLVNKLNPIKDVNFFGPNSEFIVATSEERHIYIWDKKSETLERLIQGEETFGALKPHPHVPILASSGKDICIWTPSSEKSTSDVPDENNF